MRLGVTVLAAGPALAPSDLWQAWNPDPAVLVPLAGLVALYARVVRRLWASAGRPVGIGPVRTAAFAGAVGVLVVAVVSPLDALAEALFAAHMVQHLLLLVVVPPLLLAARLPLVALQVVPVGTRRRLGRPLARVRDRLGPGAVALAAAVYVTTIAVWHVPPVYDLAVRRADAHALEHLTLLTAGTVFWAAMGARRGRARPAAAAAAFVVTLALGLLSALLSFGGAPLYGAHLTTTAAWGLTPLEDQQVAAAIMWIPGGFAHLGAATVVVLRWLGDDERRLAALGSGGAP